MNIYTKITCLPETIRMDIYQCGHTTHDFLGTEHTNFALE